MSKVYVLTATYCDAKFTEGVFSSYAAMLTYLKDKYDYTSEVTGLSNKGSGAFIESTNFTSDIVSWDLTYEAHDLIGETSHKTDKLTVN